MYKCLHLSPKILYAVKTKILSITTLIQRRTVPHIHILTQFDSYTRSNVMSDILKACCAGFMQNESE